MIFLASSGLLFYIHWKRCNSMFNLSKYLKKKKKNKQKKKKKKKKKKQ